ncbi:DNA-directed RNA polymerase II subunit 1 [Tanacetum coccineum]
MSDEDIDPNKISLWLLRIKLNREMIVIKKLSMADIAEKINPGFDDDFTCIFNDDNAEKLILRIRIINDEALKRREMLRKAIDLSTPELSYDSSDIGNDTLRSPKTPYPYGIQCLQAIPSVRVYDFQRVMDAQFSSPYVSGMGFCPASSPRYSLSSPSYSPSSSGYSPTSPGYSPTSPGYNPT